MDIGKQIAASSVIKRLFLQSLCHGGGKANATIITPQLYKHLDHQLHRVKGTIIFMGFDHITPLYIQRHAKIDGDLWLMDCILSRAEDVIVSGEVHFVHSKVILEGRPLGLTSIGPWTMDGYSWQHYYANKKKAGKLGNHLVHKFTDEVQETRFKECFFQLPRISIIDYVRELTSVNVQEINGEGHLIDGDLLLCGPYPFEFPENLTIEGDLILKDNYDQDFPNSLSVTGKLQVLSYY